MFWFQARDNILLKFFDTAPREDTYFTNVSVWNLDE